MSTLSAREPSLRDKLLAEEQDALREKEEASKKRKKERRKRVKLGRKLTGIKAGKDEK